jgi:hypothetical protein
VVAGFLLGFPIPVIALDFNAAGLVEYIQTGDEEQALHAWFLAVDRVAAPLPEELRTPEYGGGSNIVMGWLLDGIGTEHHPAVEPKILGQARAIARNVDKVRTLELRNQMVDMLKSMQTLAAFDTLRKLRTDLITDINDPTFSREQKLIARDLVARIEAAIEPYFE